KFNPEDLLNNGGFGLPESMTPMKALTKVQSFMEGYAQGLEQSNSAKKQEQGKLFRQALMLLASPNGIALTTPEDIVLQASQDIAESAQGSINFSAQKNIVGHAQDKVSLFAAQKGISAYAAKGKVELQAQDDAIEAIARKVIKLISTEDKIEITSPKEIVLTAGGSQLKINGSGIFITTGGKFESKAGQHSFVGGGTVNAQLPKLPGNGVYSNKLDLYNLFIGENFQKIEYQYLDSKTNTYVTGNLDDDGQTQDHFSDEQKEFDILVGYETPEWLSEDDLNFDYVEEKDI
uniref:DUF2345 domain-containing protein n=1 Tax=uncultured Acinetobacter sp. TaxID=165433 RepID=UPI00259AE92A